MERMTCAWLLPLLLVGGCSTKLHSNLIDAGTPPGPGVLYTLPRATFDAEVTFLVVGCERKAGLDVLKYEIGAGTVRQYLTPDPTETYRIPYNELSAPTKVTSVDIAMYPTGMIKSINSEVDDRTSQVMSAVAGTFLNLAKAYATTITPMSGSAAPGNCDTNLEQTLAARRKLLYTDLPKAKADDETLRAAQKKVDDTTTKLHAANAQLAAAQEAKDAAAVPKHKSEIANLQATLKTQQAAVAGKQERAPAVMADLAREEAALSVKAYLSGWTPKPGKLSVSISAKQDELKEIYRAITNKPLTSSLVGDFTATLAVEVESLPAAAVTPPAQGQAPASYEGLVYRLPAVGALKVSTAGSSNGLVRQSSVSLPQFGTKGAIWLRNRPFDKNSVVAAFNEDGSLVSVGFKSEAQAERAALAAQETSKSLVDLMQLRLDTLRAQADAKDEAAKKAQQAQLDSIDHQIAVLNKQRSLSEASQPSKDALDIEKERLGKEIEVEKLRQQLAELQKEAGA
ncbi:hypothetical protein [Lysobacter panacisoli]|uniref:Uncharacterized protein n=1 Tax=Lysobacter panacisoli TaxID=1255263 RepID=A0ABP9L2H8_9GAMM|nr:hypothetical protein [Lysobacter panacisoli]